MARPLAALAEAENLPALDIDPVERRLAFDPHRPLAEHGVDARDAVHWRFCAHHNCDKAARRKGNRWSKVAAGRL